MFFLFDGRKKETNRQINKQTSKERKKERDCYVLLHKCCLFKEVKNLTKFGQQDISNNLAH